MIGYHLQRAVDNWTRALADLPAGTPIKAVDGVQMLDEAKRINPGVVTILRHWYDRLQLFEGDYDNRARAFLASFVDGTFDRYAHNVDYIEGWNEYLANSQNAAEIAERVKWVEALCRVWGTEYRTQEKYKHIRLIVANAAIGNDIPIDMARTAYEWDAVLGYHPYMPMRNGVRLQDEGRWYSMRWQHMDAWYQTQGIFCDWMFTELGPLNYVVNDDGGVHLDGGGGWRHPDVCAGNVTQYIDAIGMYIDDIAAWNMKNNGRALGGVLFTTNGNGAEVWKLFETAQPEMDQISAFVGFYTPEPPPPQPPTPPDPPPIPEPEEPKMIEHIEQHIVTMRGFGAGTPESLRLRTLYHDGVKNVWSTWEPLPLPDFADIRGFEIQAQVRQVLNAPTPPPPVDELPVIGVDVSHWQGDMNWETARDAGVRFAFIKATESDYHYDRLFNANRDGCKANGILWGAYHFYRFGVDPLKQAYHFLGMLGDQTGDLPPVVDVEDTDNPFNADDLKFFLDHIEAEIGVKPIIYTRSTYWPGGVEWAKHYMLWEAEYTGSAEGEPNISPDWLDWTFWQFTSKGTGATYGASSQYIDLNVFNGKLSELLDIAS
jgi:lysozyme